MLCNRLLLFCLLLFSGRALSQDTMPPKRISVLLSPVPVPMAPTKLALQPGVQVRLRNWSLTAQVAFPVQKPSPLFANTRYFRQSGELKWFFKQRKDWQKYLSAEVLYAKRSFVDTSGGNYFKGPHEERYHYSRADIRSPILVMVVKAGAEIPITKRFFVDAFVGLGTRTIYTTYSHVEGEELNPYGLFQLDVWKSAYRYEGTFSKPHIAAGLKFGYTVW